MLIDWFTVGAQVVNFLILVWLLKRFLYKPILNAIDAREKGIAAALADADAKKLEAKKESDDFEAKNKAFDEQRGGLLAKAQEEAKAERERLFAQVQKDAEGLRAIQATALRTDQARLGDEMTRLAMDEVFQIARKALGDLAGATLEERMGEVFTRRLRALDAKSKEALGAALKSSSEPAVVRSSFDVGPEQKAAIQNSLNETFAAAIPLRFETDPASVCGIELSARGQKIGWSINSYLASLQQKVSALVEAQPAPVAKVEAAPAPPVSAVPAGAT